MTFPGILAQTWPSTVATSKAAFPERTEDLALRANVSRGCLGVAVQLEANWKRVVERVVMWSRLTRGPLSGQEPIDNC